MTRKTVKFTPPNYLLFFGALFIGSTTFMLTIGFDPNDALKIYFLSFVFGVFGLGFCYGFIYRFIKPIVIELEVRGNIIDVDCKNFVDANFELDLKNTKSLYIEKVIRIGRNNNGQERTMTSYDLVADQIDGKRNLLLFNRSKGNLKKLLMAMKKVARTGGVELKVGKRNRRAKGGMSNFIKDSMHVRNRGKKNKRS